MTVAVVSWCGADAAKAWAVPVEVGAVAARRTWTGRAGCAQTPGIGGALGRYSSWECQSMGTSVACGLRTHGGQVEVQQAARRSWTGRAWPMVLAPGMPCQFHV